MKIYKIGIGFIVLLIVGYAIYYAFDYFMYQKALENEKDQWMNEVFKPKYIKGIIYQLEKNGDGNCFTNLIIAIGEEKFSSGICLCGKNKNFSNFAAEGDTIVKRADSFRVIIIKKNSGESSEFDFPFCN